MTPTINKLNIYEETLKIGLCATFSGVVTSGLMFLLTNVLEIRQLIFVAGFFGGLASMCVLVGIKWKW